MSAKPAPNIQELLAKYTAVRTCAVQKTGQRDLIEALSRAGGSAGTISRIMQIEYQTKVNDQAITRHMRGVCTCPKR